MTITLEVPCAYLSSEFAPKICLLSGETSDLVLKPIPLVYQPSSSKVAQILLAIIGLAIFGGYTRFNIPIYHRPGMLRWKNLLFLGWAVPPLMVIGSWVLYLTTTTKSQPQPEWAMPGIIVMLGIFVLSLPTLIVLNLATVKLTVLDREGNLRISFPEKLRHVQEAYEKGFKKAQRYFAKQHKQQPSGNRQNRADGTIEESWTRDVTGEWDQASSVQREKPKQH